MQKYLKWNKKKLKVYKDAFNYRRLLVENLVFKYSQVRRQISNDKLLNKQFSKPFLKLIKREFKCLFLSLKLFLVYVCQDFELYSSRIGIFLVFLVCLALQITSSWSQTEKYLNFKIGTSGVLKFN